MKAQILCKIVVLLILLGCRGTKNLLIPVVNGKIFSKVSSLDEIIGNNSSFEIYATTNFQVRSSEPGKVISTYRIGQLYSVVIQGEYEIMYSNLNYCNVNKGDIVKRGQVIGNVPKTGYELSNAYLDILVKDRNGYAIPAENIWKKYIIKRYYQY